ncbi:MAG TPA: hypothetical protein GX735_05290 [Firmicutes bacterium]|jgi:phospholipase C|nr:hypothetical protein [Bacillota bacterium]
MVRRRSAQLRYAREDHAAMTALAAGIILADGRLETYRFLRQGQFLEHLQWGSVAADGRVCPLKHFHHPFKHTGFGDYRTSAADVAIGCYRRALELYRKGRTAAAAYNLGKALHMLQDAHVPHHAALMGVFSYLGIDPYGHYQYEGWLQGHWRDYTVVDGGIYSWQGCHTHPDYGSHQTSSERVYDWIDETAAFSLCYLDLVNRKKNAGRQDRFPETASVLVPRTLRWSAGLIAKFVEELSD